MVKKDKKETNLVKSVNKNVRSSTRKLNPILKPYSNLTIILSEKLQTKEVKDGTKG